MKTYARNYRHPVTHEGAMIETTVRGAHNYTVCCYRGSEQDARSAAPTYGPERGGRDFAREAWKRMQDRLLAEGFEVTSESPDLHQRMYDYGYRDGYAGRPHRNEAGELSSAYTDGWCDGDSDRPTLDDLTLDVAKEQVDPLGY